MKKQTIFALIAALFLAVVAFLFFFPDAMEGRVLQQHDIQQGIANGQEGKLFEEATGESTRWTNSLFGGMPNFQIAPSYPAGKALGWIMSVYTLWLPSPANLLFAMMLGFFIMCLCFKMRWYTSLFAALAWGFSSYFIIIIGAGHIWKFLTLAFIPPTIGGIALCYRGKYLGGTALASLFAALQLQSNHPQMSYYFLFVIAACVLCWLWSAWKNRKLKQWGIATACVAFAGCLGVAANSSSLYNSYEYSKETIRGRATDIVQEGKKGQEGLSYDYITGWSYGVDETLTLLIPNVKGGASVKPVGGHNEMMSLDKAPGYNKVIMSEQDAYNMPAFTQYFGDQPMTNGPVYVGAFVFVLAVLAMFVVDGPLIWGLFGVSVLAILLSWGHNFPAFTNFFIDNFPGYNKFRTVSSILVIVEFTLPLMAALCLRKIIDTPDFFAKYKWQFYCVTGVCAFICLLGWLAPSIFGTPFALQEVEAYKEAGYWNDPSFASLWSAVRNIRLDLVSADSLRSLLFILLGAAILWAYITQKVKLKPELMVLMVSAVVLVDLFSVNKRYVNSENFLDPVSEDYVFNRTAADEAILKDAGNYRVLDIADFGGARTSYFHKAVGGYHAAKLTRYNDLLTYKLNPIVQGMNQWLQQGNPIDSLLVDNQTLNMLNAKYFMAGDRYVENPYAQGNAWFVEKLNLVDKANDEMDMIDKMHIGKEAVADKSFAAVLGTAKDVSPGDTIYETSYAPNKLDYRYKSANGGLAVFSEVYFPWGWKAEVDGKEVPIGRVNYVLRAMQLPAGEHTLTMTFNPKSIRVTDTVSTVAIVVIYLLCGGALALVAVRISRRKKQK